MKTTLRDIGNSKGIVIPAKLIKELNLCVGDEIDVRTEDGSLVCTPSKDGRLTLTQLLSRCKPDAPFPKVLTQWEQCVNVRNEDLK